MSAGFEILVASATIESFDWSPCSAVADATKKQLYRILPALKDWAKFKMSLRDR
jgi:hypothetical protein